MVKISHRSHTDITFAPDGSETYVLDTLRHQLATDPISHQSVLARTLEARVTRRSPSIEQRRRILFQLHRQEIARSFLAELDRKITDGQIAKLTAPAGGVKIVWNRRLQTTAGQIKLRRTILKDTYREYRIELADKIVNDENRLYNVMAHEFCHLANIMISHITTEPHGKGFKEWGATCSKMFRHLGVIVTTTHSYT